MTFLTHGVELDRFDRQVVSVVDLHVLVVEGLVVPVGVGPAWPDRRDHAVVSSVDSLAVLVGIDWHLAIGVDGSLIVGVVTMLVMVLGMVVVVVMLVDNRLLTFIAIRVLDLIVFFLFS